MKHASSRAALLVFAALLFSADAPGQAAQTPPRDSVPKDAKGTAVIRGRVVAADTKKPLRRVQLRLGGTPPRDQAPAKPGTGTIRGTVVAADTGMALSGVSVRAFTEDLAYTGRLLAGSMSDENGRFEITQLPPGEYILYAGVGRDRALYVSWMYGARKYGEYGPRIHVAEGALVEKIVFPVPRAGAISGRVVNEKGDPMAWVYVNALMVPPGGGTPNPVGSPRLTDDYGRFRIFGLVPGRYYVKAEAEAAAWAGAPDGRDVPRYLPTFFPAALTADEAQQFKIEAGEEISDLDIAVRRSRTYRVTGAVVGRPSAASRVNLAYSRDTRSWASTMLPAEDTFSVSGLLPAEYTFIASTFDPGDSETEPEASDPLVVTVDQNIDGLVLSLHRGARISGHVTLAVDQEKLPSPLRVVAAAPTAGASPVGRPPTTIVKADGIFNLTRVFGASVLGVQEVQPSIRQVITYRGKDITDLPTEFRDSSNPRDLEILLTDKGAEITGRVSDAKGPVEHARVLVFSADTKRWGTWAHGFRQTGTDAQGRFSIKPLRADKYLVVAFEAAAGFGPLDPTGFAKIAALATPVEVAENDAREISLAPAKLPQ